MEKKTKRTKVQKDKSTKGQKDKRTKGQMDKRFLCVFFSLLLFVCLLLLYFLKGQYMTFPNTKHFLPNMIILRWPYGSFYGLLVNIGIWSVWHDIGTEKHNFILIQPKITIWHCLYMILRLRGIFKYGYRVHMTLIYTRSLRIQTCRIYICSIMSFCHVQQQWQQ